MSVKTTPVELTDAEIRLLIEAVETRLEHLRDWGRHKGLWATPGERESILTPLEHLERVLLNA